MQTYTRRQTLLAVTSLAFPLLASSQTVQYRRIDVSNRVDITVPGHWRVRDTSERQNIATAADALLNPAGKLSEPMHVSSLSVISTPEPSQAIIRVSFVIEKGTQADFEQDLKRGKETVLAELALDWKDKSKSLSEAMQNQGIRYLGDEQFDVLRLGSKLAFMISYKRSSARGDSPYVVQQYHVPIGPDKVLLTMSMQESAKTLLGPILDRIKSSISIRN